MKNLSAQRDQDSAPDRVSSIALHPVGIEHVPALWDMVCQYPRNTFFEEDQEIVSYSQFLEWFNRCVIDGLVAVKNSEVVGFGGATYIDKFAMFNVINKRRSMEWDETVRSIRAGMQYFCNKYHLEAICAFTKQSNRAVNILLKRIGFKTTAQQNGSNFNIIFRGEL